jgi:hypothetical protein
MFSASALVSSSTSDSILWVKIPLLASSVQLSICAISFKYGLKEISQKANHKTAIVQKTRAIIKITPKRSIPNSELSPWLDLWHLALHPPLPDGILDS